MTDTEVCAWSEGRDWSHQFALSWREGVPLENHRPVWHECSGPEDPDCGNCRFSVHGCNGDGPSRARYLEWYHAGTSTVRSAEGGHGPMDPP